MANTDKNIVITPNNGSASDPNIVFSGANATTGAQNITLTVTPNNSGTVAFSGSAGQLLAINNDISNTLSTGGTISATGNITANNFVGNLVGNVTGNFSGSLANGNSNVSIPAANGNVNISAVGNANIVVVTGTGANVVGTLSVSGDANVGNIGATNGVFTNVSGNGSSLSSITGGNVTGQVGNALVAGTVYTAAQPNITSVGTLSSLSVSGTATLAAVNGTDASFSGNATVNGNLFVNGNLTYLNVETVAVEDPIIQLQTGANGAAPIANSGKDVGTALNYYDTAAKIAFMGWDVSNAEIAFGSNVSITNEVVTFTSLANTRSGNTLTTGVFATTLSATGNITAGNLIGIFANGNSNVSIPAANGNINFSVGGQANEVVFTSTGANVNGYLSVSGNANVGNIGATNGVFTNVSGNGSLLTAINGSNVTTGTVALARLPTLANTTDQTQGQLIRSGDWGLATTAFAGSGTDFTANTYNYSQIFRVLSSTATGPGISGGGVVMPYDGTPTTTYVVAGAGSDAGRLFTGYKSSASATPTWYEFLRTSSTGNANIGNLAVTGLITATGNITGGNIIGSLHVGNLSGTGNSNVGNLGATGVFATTLSATGNANVGNLGVSGLISATGALTASSYTASNSLAGYFLANTGTTVGKIFENANIIKLEAIPATYGVALAANGTVQLSFDANGYGAIGSSSGTTGYALRIAKNTTGAVTAGSILINPTVQTDVTSLATGVRTSLNTAAGASPYTITNLVGYATYGGTIGANTTVTNQIAYYVDANATGGTNNWGFYGGLASAASTFNLYMQGTANNYLGGSLGIGSTSLSAINMRVSKSLTGGTTAFNFVSDGTIQSDVTTNAVLNRVVGQTQAATFTLTNLIYNQAVQGTFGLNSTVTTQSGFTADNTLTGATNNYGFRGSIASGANRFNLYMDGTANNYMAGNLGIGTTSPAVALHVKQNAGSINVEGTDQAFIQFYPRTVANIRTAYVGIGSAGSNNFTIRNDDNGRLLLESGNSNVSVFANGNVTTTVAGVANVVVVTSTGANIAGTLSATGNITGNFFIGNGSQLTGITATTATSLANGTSNVSIPAVNGNINLSSAGNANIVVVTGTGANLTGTLSTTGNISGGGNLIITTAITRNSRNVPTYVAQATAPSSPLLGDQWYDTDTGQLYQYQNDGTSSYWQDMSTNVGTLANLSVTGNIVGGNLIGVFANGTSNISIPAVNGNINFSSAGNANILIVTGTGANIAGTLNVTGNTTFSGVGQRILGDFSNATYSSRTAIQNKTTNSATYVPILPNGTNNNASITVFNASDQGNSSYGTVNIDTTKVQLESGNVGTGTYLPMTFAIGGSERARFDTGGNLLVGTTNANGANNITTSIIGGIHQTIKGQVTAASGVATTLFTMPSQSFSTWMVTVQLAAADTTNYSAWAMIATQTGSVRIMTNVAGTLLTISNSGLAIQATQSSGTSSTIYYSAIRIM